jgi:hypothetical protein
MIDTPKEIIKKAQESIQNNLFNSIMLLHERGEKSLSTVIAANIDDLSEIASFQSGYNIKDGVFKFTEFMRGNPQYYNCSPASIMRTFRQSVYLGLMVSETAGEIWISDYNDDQTGELKMDYIVGTKGLQVMAKRHSPDIHHFDTFVGEKSFEARIYWGNANVETSCFSVSFEGYAAYVSGLKKGKYFHELYPHRMGQYLAMRELLRPKHFHYSISEEIIKQEKNEMGL